MRKLFALLLIVFQPAFGLAADYQFPFPGGHSPIASAVTPGIYDSHLMGSTETTAVGVKVDNTCITNTLCGSTANPTKSGNTVAVVVTWDDTASSCNSSTAITVSTPDNGDTYTPGPVVHDTTVANHRWMAGFYKIGATTGTHNIYATAAGACTQMHMVATTLYNVNAFDVGCTASNANGSTTGIVCGSMTTTANKDIILDYAVRAQNPLTATGFTAGSGWTLKNPGAKNGLVMQYQVQTTAGAITPSLDWAPGSGGPSIAMAFKSAAAGTAPSGYYIANMQDYNSPTAGTGTTFVLPFPTIGNLQLSVNSCGGSGPMKATGYADNSGNTAKWRPSGVDNWDGVGSDPLSNTWYAPNSTPSSTNVITITAAGTGDCSWWLRDVVGADTDPFLAHVGTWKGAISATGATYNPIQFENGTVSTSWGLYPGASGAGEALAIGSTGIQFNTNIGIASPTGAVFNSSTYGHEDISGPSTVDEENANFYFFNVDNSLQTYSLNVTRTTAAISGLTTTIDTFLKAGATRKPTWVDGNSCSTNAAGTSLVCTFRPHRPGNVLAIAAAENTGSGNITFTDSASNTVTKVSGNDACTPAMSASFCMKLWYIASTNSSAAETFTFTFPTAAAFRSVSINELTGVSTLDASGVQTVTIASNVSTSTALTLTGSSDVMVDFGICQGTCSNGTGMQFARGDGGGNGTVYRVTSSSGSFSTVINDTSSGSNGHAIMAFK